MGNEFWDDLGRRVTGTADLIGRKTEEMIEVTKLKNKMYASEREMARCYERLGREFFRQYKTGGTSQEALQTLCEMTAQEEEKLERIREEVERRG